ncbi:hypothetical protein LguiB_030858 [Lonicera macranthoides]
MSEFSLPNQTHFAVSNSQFLEGRNLVNSGCSNFFFMCDGAFEASPPKAASACILFNKSLKVCDNVAKRVTASSALVSEALTVKEACCIGASRNLGGAIICSDSKTVISLASLDLNPPWKIEALMGDIRQFATKFGFIFLHVKKYQNVIAHRVIREAIHGPLLCNWFFVIPSSVRRLPERWF